MYGTLNLDAASCTPPHWSKEQVFRLDCSVRYFPYCVYRWGLSGTCCSTEAGTTMKQMRMNWICVFKQQRIHLPHNLKNELGQANASSWLEEHVLPRHPGGFVGESWYLRWADKHMLCATYALAHLPWASSQRSAEEMVGFLPYCFWAFSFSFVF